MRAFSAAAAVCLCASSVFAAPVDLTGWTVEDRAGRSVPNWDVAADKNSVQQRANSRPSVFFNGNESAQGRRLTGSFRITRTSDDDFAGFVLGFDAGELSGTANPVDFWLIDWKQRDQYWASGGGTAKAGLALSHVTSAPASEGAFWVHNNGVAEVQRASTLGSTGWVKDQTYLFDIVFAPTLIEVKVDGVTELSYSSAAHGSRFSDGAFGFYNYSQDNVIYAGVTETTANVPVPASLPLLAGAFGALALRRKRRS